MLVKLSHRGEGGDGVYFYNKKRRVRSSILQAKAQRVGGICGFFFMSERRTKWGLLITCRKEKKGKNFSAIFES